MVFLETRGGFAGEVTRVFRLVSLFLFVFFLLLSLLKFDIYFWIYLVCFVCFGLSSLLWVCLLFGLCVCVCVTLCDQE